MPTRQQAGFTLVEMMISCAIIIIIVAVAMSSVSAVITANDHDEARLAEVARYRNTMAALKADLTASTTLVDPVTAQSRYNFGVDPNGKPTMRFQKLIGAQMVSGGLKALWSPWIEIHVGSDGRVTRTDGTTSTVIGSGIDRIDFAVQDIRFVLTLTTAYRDPVSGQVVQHTYSDYVTPLN